jgi:hypothetical protein
VSECDYEPSKMSRPWPTGTVAPWFKKNNNRVHHNEASEAISTVGQVQLYCILNFVLIAPCISLYPYSSCRCHVLYTSYVPWT